VPPKQLLWAVPLVFAVHDAEEIATVERWSASHASLLPAAARRFVPMPTLTFAVSVAVILAVLLVASALDAARLHRGKPILWSVFSAATLIANGLTHPLQALLFRGYTPGVVTAVVVLIPFAVWLYRDGRRRGWLTQRRALLLVGIGFVLQAPAAALAILAARALSA
jgi:hypothetical protein